MSKPYPLSLCRGLGVVSLLCWLTLGSPLGCESPPDDAAAPAAGDATARRPAEDDDALARQLMDAGEQGVPTAALVQQLPSLDRDRAYRIQLATLRAEEARGAKRTGWKLGGTRVTDSSAAPDPLFGFSLASQIYPQDQPISMDHFMGKPPLLEAEVALHIGKDLPGPEVTREELVEAVEGVSGALELISSRLDTAATSTTEHALADNLSHGGVVLGQKRVPLNDIDFEGETARAEIDGVEKARGSAKDIMGTAGDPLDAVLWLANELPRHGLHLQAGDYVITGSMYDNPALSPGEHAVVTYTTLGTISVSLAPEAAADASR